MGRPRNTIERTQLNVRVDQQLKDRLLAIAYHELSRNRGIAGPEEVNISDYVRNLLEMFVNESEPAYGGREQLAAELARASVDALEAQAQQWRSRIEGERR